MPRRRQRAGTILLAALVALAGGAHGAEAAAKKKPSRYSIVKGCFALKSAEGGPLITKDGAGYSASAPDNRAAEGFRMQATELGRYLLYGEDEDFLAIQGSAARPANEPSPASEWTARGRRGVFRLVNQAAGRDLLIGDGGELRSTPSGAGTRFRFRRAPGCAVYPEAQLNASGPPSTGRPKWGTVRGLLEGHMHGMAFEFLGGEAHCGKPWHRYGAPYALRDCIDHEASDGCGAILENILYGDPARCHDPVGWPTFNDWPHPDSLTHESMYYRWLERAWRGGLRVYVNLFVENRVLCEIYPTRHNSCNEMDSVLLQAQRIRELESYIDAQSGGPGKGWFRIVEDPFEARRAINRGKLAVVQGVEVSEPFNCRLVPVDRPDPRCTRQGISDWIDRLDDLGVRQMEITNKFDNALTGVAGDGGNFGIAINGGQFLFTSGTFWDLGPCENPHYHDNSPGSAVLPDQDLIFGIGLKELLGELPPQPIYTAAPNCNQRGLSGLGEHAIRELVDHGIVFDPDHQSVLARQQALDLVEELEYPGMITSHSWSTDDALPRIYRLGGVITPYAGDSGRFVHNWEKVRAVRDQLGRQYFGVGFGADANGFGSQGSPRESAAENPLVYPFKSFDGKVTFDRQVSGERTFDLNADGVAHYGLYPDWIADLGVIAGPRIVRDMGRGAEAYLQMWERAYGVPEIRCRGWRQRRLTAAGITGALRIGAWPARTLKRAGQPVFRKRIFRWCAGGERQVVAAFKGGRVTFILSSVRTHRARGVGPGTGARRVRRVARHVGSGVWRSGRFVFVVRGGKVTHAGTAKSRAVPARMARAAR